MFFLHFGNSGNWHIDTGQSASEWHVIVPKMSNKKNYMLITNIKNTRYEIKKIWEKVDKVDLPPITVLNKKIKTIIITQRNLLNPDIFFLVFM